jgi:hypothetical protein
MENPLKYFAELRDTGGFDEERAMPNAKMTNLRMMAPCRRLAAHARMSNSDQLSAT